MEHLYDGDSNDDDDGIPTTGGTATEMFRLQTSAERPGVPWPNGKLPLLDKPARPASEGEKRALQRARVARIDMPDAARTDFSAMRPDFAMLEEHESKVQRLAGRVEDEGLVIPSDKDVRSVMSSTAGAGSNDFHEYRHARRQERGRLAAAHAVARKAKEREQWESEQGERAVEQEEKTAKRAAKRQRQKAAKRAATGGADAAEDSHDAGVAGETVCVSSV